MAFQSLPNLAINVFQSREQRAGIEVQVADIQGNGLPATQAAGAEQIDVPPVAQADHILARVRSLT